MNLKQLAIGIAATVVIVVILLVLFGEKQLDTDDLEPKLAATVAAEAEIPAELISVSCPDDVAADAGTTFECTATGEAGSEEWLGVEDAEAPVTVELVDDDGRYTATFDVDDLTQPAQ